MTTKKEEFIPIIDGINANEYPEEKEGDVKFTIQNENFQLFEKFFKATCPGKVRDIPVNLEIELSYYEGHDDILIFSIDSFTETAKVAKQLPGGGINQGLDSDFALAGHHLAKEFCRLNNLTINYEVGHWPLLQYVLLR